MSDEAARIKSEREHLTWARDTLGAGGMDGLSAVNLAARGLEMCDVAAALIAERDTLAEANERLRKIEDAALALVNIQLAADSEPFWEAFLALRDAAVSVPVKEARP